MSELGKNVTHNEGLVYDILAAIQSYKSILKALLYKDHLRMYWQDCHRVAPGAGNNF
jgi:hypothetical protein